MDPCKTPPTEGDSVLGGSPMVSYNTLCFHGLRLAVIHGPGDCNCNDIEPITVGSSAPQGTEYFLLIPQPLCSFLVDKFHVFPGVEVQ